MSTRRKVLYKKVFEFLRDELDINPGIFTSDYETAMRNAAREVWPRTRMPGCVFHFRQAVKKNYRRLVKEPQNIVLKRRCRKIKQMAFNWQMLPARKMKKGMKRIMQEITRMRLEPWLTDFYEYFKKWLRLKRHLSMYLIVHRTNNCNEALNSRMSRIMCSHPNVFEFLQQMKKIIKKRNHDKQKGYRPAQQSYMTAGLQRGWLKLQTRQWTTLQFLTMLHLRSHDE